MGLIKEAFGIAKQAVGDATRNIGTNAFSSIGGIAKGNIVCEIDALGGQMAKLIDRSMIQFRLLNKSRGPAVQAPRSQAARPTETETGVFVMV